MAEDELIRPEVTRAHATLTSAYPPGEETFAGQIMLRLAGGIWEDTDDLIPEFQELAEEFEEFFPDEPAVDSHAVPDLIAAVLAEHQRVVTETSYDAIALYALADLLLQRGIVLSWGEGFDSSEATEQAAVLGKIAREQGVSVRGYCYAHAQDIDRLILTGRLYLGFGVFGPRDDAAAEVIGAEVVEILRAAALPTEWSGSADARIVCEPLLYELEIED